MTKLQLLPPHGLRTGRVYFRRLNIKRESQNLPCPWASRQGLEDQDQAEAGREWEGEEKQSPSLYWSDKSPD